MKLKGNAMVPIRRLFLVLTYSSLVGLVAFTGLAAAQSPHRPCNTKDPPLSRGERDVVSDDPAFVDAITGRSYGFSIFGLGRANPDVMQQPYQICLRYEFVSRSDEVIQKLRWRDIGIQSIRSVQPGARYKIPVRKVSNTTAVATSKTQLYAFENLLAEGRTVETVEESRPRAKEAQQAGGGMFEFSLLQSSPALAMKLADARVSTGAVPAFAFPSQPAEYPLLSIGLENPEISISIESSAKIYPNDFFGTIQGTIQVTKRAEGPLTLYAPGLLALQRINFVSIESLDARSTAFLERLPDSMAPLKISGSMYKSSVDFKIATKKETPPLFVAKHPVTIAVGSWSACLMAETYSPVPVALTDAHCRNP